MIFEINEKYVRERMLPQLVAEYLNPVERVYDVSVSRAGPEGGVIFSTRGDRSSVAVGADATAGLFLSQVVGPDGRGRGRFRDEAGPSRWTIAVRHRAGSLDAAVASARRRNLFASWILVGLLGGTAWALVRYTGRSRRLADMQFRFAAGISHDLRTPLTAIRGAAFNLIEGVVKDPAAVRRYLRLILRNADELTAMIENVLAFSASLHSNKHGRCEAIAVGDVLQHAVSAMMQEIEQAGCRIEVNIAHGLPAVAGDPVAVELVFRNLIGNAVRYGVGGKWIGVSAAAFGDGVEVRVCDHGPGIPEPEQERIFEPFYRGEQTRAQRVPGTGLGLSLVKNTIEQYQGTVEVINSSGGGAQFTVRLPALQQSA
jgi:two-component system, OmpR family, sensor histidine kinase SenX3